MPSFWTTLPQRYYLATVADYHTFSPNVTNELRFGYNRFSQFYTVTELSSPAWMYSPTCNSMYDLGLQVGPDSIAPVHRPEHLSVSGQPQLDHRQPHPQGRLDDFRDIISPSNSFSACAAITTTPLWSSTSWIRCPTIWPNATSGAPPITETNGLPISMPPTSGGCGPT